MTIRPTYFPELADAVPLDFDVFNPQTEEQKAVVAAADEQAKAIVAGIMSGFADRSQPLRKYYASLSGSTSVWPSDPSPAMSVIDDVIEHNERHPLNDRTLYHCTLALVHHDMLVAIKKAEKSPAEIEALKAEWRANGVSDWDLETAEGFEGHYDELKAYSQDYIAQRRDEFEKKEIAAAERMGCSIETYRVIEMLQQESAELRERIGNLEHQVHVLERGGRQAA